MPGRSGIVKLFVDANTLISGLLFLGNERLLLELGRYGTCDLITIEYVREEVRDFLGRPGAHLSGEEQRRLMTVLDRGVIALGGPPAGTVREASGPLRDETDLPRLVGFETPHLCPGASDRAGPGSTGRGGSHGQVPDRERRRIDFPRA